MVVLDINVDDADRLLGCLRPAMHVCVQANECDKDAYVQFTGMLRYASVAFDDECTSIAMQDARISCVTRAPSAGRLLRSHGRQQGSQAPTLEHLLHDALLKAHHNVKGITAVLPPLWRTLHTSIALNLKTWDGLPCFKHKLCKRHELTPELATMS